MGYFDKFNPFYQEDPQVSYGGGAPKYGSTLETAAKVNELRNMGSGSPMPSQPPMPSIPAMQTGQGMPAPEQPKGLLDSIGGFLDDNSSFLNKLGAGYFALHQDPQLQKLGMSRIQEMQDLKTSNAQSNKTVQAMLKAGKINKAEAEMLLANPALIAPTYTAMLKDERTSLQKDYEAAVAGGYKGSIVDFKASSAPKTTITNTMGAADEDFWKEFRKGEAEAVNVQADRLPELTSSVNQIQMLRRLGQGLETSTSIPTYMRPYVPKGVSSPLDAYNSVAYGVAQSLRVAGSGPMTDKDFDVLVERAGSASLSPEARAIVQTGLEAAVKMNLDLARAAQEFRSNPSVEARKAYQEKVAEIASRRLFTDEQQAMLDGYSGARQPIEGVPVGFIETLSPNDYELLKSGKIDPADIEAAVQKWRTGG